MTPADTEDSYRSADWHLLAGQTNQTPQRWSRWAGPESWKTGRRWTEKHRKGSSQKKNITQRLNQLDPHQILEMMSQRFSVSSRWVCFMCWTEASCWSSFQLRRPLQHKSCWSLTSLNNYYGTQSISGSPHITACLWTGPSSIWSKARSFICRTDKNKWGTYLSTTLHDSRAVQINRMTF